MKRGAEPAGADPDRGAELYYASPTVTEVGLCFAQDAARMETLRVESSSASGTTFAANLPAEQASGIGRV